MTDHDIASAWQALNETKAENARHELARTALSAHFGGHWDMLDIVQQVALVDDLIDLHEAELMPSYNMAAAVLSQRLGFSTNPEHLATYADVIKAPRVR